MNQTKPQFKKIEFLRPYSVAGNPAYETGEQHEFRDWIADLLIQRGEAKPVEPAPEAKP